MSKRLTKVQKEMIGTLTDQGFTPEQIAKQFDVPVTTIQKQAPTQEVTVTNPDIVRDAVNLVRQSTGFNLKKAKDLVAKALRKSTGDIPSAKHLARLASKEIGPQEIMITNTGEGNGGVAIMTEAASARGDEGKKKSLSTNRMTRGTLFNAKTGESLE
jgi:hypothetical protein